jgi:GxxExxY protein
LSELDPALTEISRKVIGCAIDVHRSLGPGYDESVYLAALCSGLDDEDITYSTNHAFDVMYGEEKVGQTVADLYVGDRFLVEIMAFHGQIGTQERTHLRAQLRAADLELGLIINFGERRLKDGLVRVLNPDKLEALRARDEEHEDHDEEHSEEHED